MDLSPFLNCVSAGRIRSHIQALEGPRHPQSAPQALERAADYVWESLQSLGYAMTVHRFCDNGGEYRNIIATHRGARFPDERLILLAHFDTVEETPGADDNASGVAVMLELATVLKPLRFERSILFVGVNLEENGGEETAEFRGRRGSKALARYARENGWSIEGVVVFESVAFASDYVVQTAPAGIPVDVPEVGNFIAVVGNDDSLALARGFAESVERHRLPLPCQTLIVPGAGEIIPDCRRSDHASFWDEGYRAIMITDTTNFRSPHYHQPSDTLETLNLPFATRVCQATTGLVMDMAMVCGED